jgi:elongation factor P
LAIGITEVKAGMTIELDGVPMIALEYQHVKMAQRAWVRAKLKNLRTGAIFEKTFNVDEKVEKAHIERREMQFIYHEGDLYHFMDQETFDQIAIPKEKMGDVVNYLLDGSTATVLFYDKEIIGVEIPNSIIMKVVEAPPGFKGDTVSGGSKPAQLESGITVYVPLFVNTGDKVKVDTRTGKYVERA